MSKFIVLSLIVLLALVCFTSAEEAQVLEATTDGAAETLHVHKRRHHGKRHGKRRHIRKGKFVSRKCLKWQKRTCEYVTACQTARNKCVRSKRQRVCLKRVSKTVRVRKAVCLRYSRRNRCSGKRRCIRSGFKIVRKIVNKCVRKGVRKTCLKRKVVCVKRKLIRRCTWRENPHPVRGPRKCRRGYRLTITRKGKFIVRKCVRVPRHPPKPEPTKTCFSFLDPHTSTFRGGFEFQHEGDYLFAETADGVFRVDYRLKRFGGWTGPIAVAIRPNGVDVLEYTVGNQGSWKLNGRPLAVPNGQKVELKNGGTVEAKFPNFVVTGPNGQSAVIVVYAGYTANLYVNIPQSQVAGVRGVCNQQKVLSTGLFAFAYKTKYFDTVIKIRHPSARRVNAARDRCRQILGPRHRGFRLHACIHDRLAMARGPARTRLMREEGRIGRELRHEKRVSRRLSFLRK